MGQQGKKMIILVVGINNCDILNSSYFKNYAMLIINSFKKINFLKLCIISIDISAKYLSNNLACSDSFSYDN